MKPETKKKIGEWYTRFKCIFDKTDNLALKLGEEYSTKTVFPTPDKIFKAFELCKYANCKVVIIGQDPYPNTFKKNYKEIPYAMGYAFGNPHEASILSPSLRQIGDAVQESKYLFLDQSLEDWQNQGVLLLNASLTVVKNEPNSHKELWKEFTENLILSLGSNQSMIFMLWGKEAQSFKKYIDPTYCYILEAEHPVAGSYSGRKWNYNDCFNKCNNIIKNIYSEEDIIIW